MTPGYKTSEFALACVVIVSATVLLALGKLDSAVWQWAVGLTSGVYTASRSATKIAERRKGRVR